MLSLLTPKFLDQIYQDFEKNQLNFDKIYLRLGQLKVNFTTISSQFSAIYINKFYKNWGSDGHFEVLNRSESQLVQKLSHKTQMRQLLQDGNRHISYPCSLFARKRLQLWV